MFTTLTRRSVKAFARRNMSGGASNAEEESKRWFKLSVGRWIHRSTSSYSR